MFQDYFFDFLHTLQRKFGQSVAFCPPRIGADTSTGDSAEKNKKKG